MLWNHTTTGEIMKISEQFENLSKQLKYPDPKMPRAVFIATKEQYRKKRSELNLQFEHALYKEYGVENNPKRQKCFELAWEHGHSSGFSEVENYFSEFVELIK